MGIVVHSVIIGISLGASQSPKTIEPLVAALSFHQLFEGMGLGGCITQYKSWTFDAWVLEAAFLRAAVALVIVLFPMSNAALEMPIGPSLMPSIYVDHAPLMNQPPASHAILTFPFDSASVAAKFNALKGAVMSIFFTLTMPVGVAIGSAFTNSYNENSPTALIVEGLLNAASAGILIYMALVDLIQETFKGPIDC
ncbi:hypothetical protein Vadar_031990 [Vaccinium darrowii]|uniref:Uncharacterized protein n=1 Tax=Vaccinium darrowii TaxID=229202 RepID=A0ACB7X5P0_9ERIC|nr:hypothetical protein Vadar_031990 [Vaccinium darrowii]